MSRADEFRTFISNFKKISREVTLDNLELVESFLGFRARKRVVFIRNGEGLRAGIHINYFSDVDWINGASCFLSDKEEKITLSMTVYFNEASADWLTCAADWVEQAEKQDKILKDASWPDGEIRVHAGMVFYCAFQRSFIPPRIPFPVEL